MKGRGGAGACWARSTSTDQSSEWAGCGPGRRLFAGLDMDGDIEFAVGLAAEDPVGRGHVGIVAADGGADVAMMGDEVVGGVEAHPAQVGQEHIDPGVSGVRGGAVVILAAAVEVAGDVAGGDADMAQEGDHGVGKVLANALAADDGLIDRESTRVERGTYSK